MGLFFTINGLEVLRGNKNKIRTLWGWKASKNKNIEPQRNFTSSYKKKCIYLKKLLLKFSNFEKFFTRSVFGKLQLMQTLLNFKILKLLKPWVAFLLFIFFERNYDVLKSKRQSILLKKNINSNKKETEWKIENFTNSFREKPCASAHIRIANKK